MSEKFFNLLLEAKKPMVFEPDDTDDYTEDVDTNGTNEEVEGNEGEQDTKDYTDEVDDNETEDYNDEVEDGGDYLGDSTGDENINNMNNEEKNKKNKLIRDFISFYNLIKNAIDKISEVDKTDIITNKISTQVMINLTNLRKLLFDYITMKFNMNSYVVNLYQYNQFLEALKINIKMLQKINVLNDKYKTNI